MMKCELIIFFFIYLFFFMERHRRGQIVRRGIDVDLCLFEIVWYLWKVFLIICNFLVVFSLLFETDSSHSWLLFVTYTIRMGKVWMTNNKINELIMFFLFYFLFVCFFFMWRDIGVVRSCDVKLTQICVCLKLFDIFGKFFFNYLQFSCPFFFHFQTDSMHSWLLFITCTIRIGKVWMTNDEM